MTTLVREGWWFMELWFATLVVIVALVTIAAFVARRWRPEAPLRALGPVLAARLAAVVIVTALVVAAKVAIGPLAAAVTGVVGVLVAVVLLIWTGYARIPPIAGTRR